tara:strand:- start:1005 stop:1217 length:213 start_codon:yes stop_codon:yes gene_type:complete
VRRAFNLQMKRRFDELGIEIPFPHQTIYFGEGRDGNAPAAPVGRRKPDGRRVRLAQIDFNRAQICARSKL